MLKKIIPITFCATMLMALIPMAIAGMSNDEETQNYNELNASSVKISEADYIKLSGGVLVDTSTIVSTAQNHTLYANWIIETPVEGTDPLID